MFSINISELRGGSKNFDFEIPTDVEFLSGTSIGLAGPASVKLRATRYEEQIVFIKGDIHYVLELSCRRCLETFEDKRNCEVMLVYQLESNTKTWERNEDSDDQIIVLPYHTDEIDLKDSLKEVLVLDYPIYALCQKTCRGICTSCGVNLNSIKCQCEEVHYDERWAELSKLKN